MLEFLWKYEELMYKFEGDSYLFEFLEKRILTFWLKMKKMKKMKKEKKKRKERKGLSEGSWIKLNKSLSYNFETIHLGSSQYPTIRIIFGSKLSALVYFWFEFRFMKEFFGFFIWLKRKEKKPIDSNFIMEIFNWFFFTQSINC